MPAFSTRIEEEGVLIDNWLLVRDGELREAATLDLLRSALHPSRNPGVNLADLRAQIAANEKGVAELGRMVDHFGLDVVQAYMGHVQDNAEESVRRVIGALRDGEYAYELDNGAVIKVAVRVDRAARSAEIDFTGTSPQLPDNFNAPSSVGDGRGAVRLPHPRRRRHPAELRLPEAAPGDHPAGLDAQPGRTRRRWWPATWRPRRRSPGRSTRRSACMAEGSGTMNNFTFGNDRHQYYETVASGSGPGTGSTAPTSCRRT